MRIFMQLLQIFTLYVRFFLKFVCVNELKSNVESTHFLTMTVMTFLTHLFSSGFLQIEEKY